MAQENAVDALRGTAYSLGSTDIDYHFIIMPDGTIYEGRDIRARGSHVENVLGEEGTSVFGNTGSIGIVLVGCFDQADCGNNYTEQPSQDQVNALDGLTTMLTNSLPKIGCMAGHGKFPGQKQTVCPGGSCNTSANHIAEMHDLNYEEPASCYQNR